MIEVQIASVAILNNEFIVLLRAEGDDKVLPIHIDPSQAHSIQLQLQGLTFPRPLTHDLMKNIIVELGGQLVRAEVNDLEEGTFYARLIVARDGKEIVIDARPSDAIALALRAEAPIFVQEEVMGKAGVMVDTESKDGKALLNAAHGTRKLTAVEELEHRLKKAITEERYEDAAALRDELNKIKESKASN